MAINNPPGNTDPFSAQLVYMAPTLASSLWTGHQGAGHALLTTTGPTATEQYVSVGPVGVERAYGLSARIPGEYWYAGIDTEPTDRPIVIYRGVLDGAGVIAWALQTRIVPAYARTGGVPQSTSISIAFSPDGSAGWVGFLGDLVQGNRFSPIFIRSTDGGTTWEPPVEVDLDTVPVIGAGARRQLRVTAS